MKFAQNLHRLAKDVTYQEIADACGVTHQAVGKWFRGDDVPAFDFWPALAKCLGVTIHDLLPPK